MGTRSRVGVQLANGTVRSTYVHYDGYPSGVGAELLRSYNSAPLADQLTQHGYFSGLYATAEESYGKSVEHNRDMPPEVSQTPQGLHNKADSWGCEWVYLHADGAWQYSRVFDGGKPQWQPLTPEVVGG